MVKFWNSCISEWEGRLTLHKGGGSRLFMTMTMTIWWPTSGVWIYQLVTGSTSVVGVPSTHLVNDCTRSRIFSSWKISVHTTLVSLVRLECTFRIARAIYHFRIMAILTEETSQYSDRLIFMMIIAVVLNKQRTSYTFLLWIYDGVIYFSSKDKTDDPVSLYPSVCLPSRLFVKSVCTFVRRSTRLSVYNIFYFVPRFYLYS